MKIRNGFVSNSSSASFVLTAHCSWEILVNALNQNFEYSLFNKDDEIKRIDKQICVHETSLLETSNNVRDKEFDEKWLKYYNDYKNDLQKAKTYDEVVEVMMNDNGSNGWDRIELEKGDTYVKFIGWTPMYNDLTSAGDRMMGIMAACAVQGIEIDFEVEED